MPAARWPGTEQKNVYVPGFRVRLSDFDPPVKVGVAPSAWPLLDSIVRLWATGDAFVKLIETFPVLAVSVEASNLSCPLGSAASASDEEGAAPDVGAVGVEVAGVLPAGAVGD